MSGEVGYWLRLTRPGVSILLYLQSRIYCILRKQYIWETLSPCAAFCNHCVWFIVFPDPVECIILYKRRCIQDLPLSRLHMCGSYLESWSLPEAQEYSSCKASCANLSLELEFEQMKDSRNLSTDYPLALKLQTHHGQAGMSATTSYESHRNILFILKV